MGAGADPTLGAGAGQPHHHLWLGVRLQTALFPAGPPSIKAVKKSEHATEGETVILVCKSDSFPPVTNWLWYKESESGDQVITNSTQSKFFVVSSESRTELHIPNVDLKEDPGKYVCNGTNLEGTSQAAITLRVRNRFAALWPFLGIVAEVLVLVTIIFIYEKRRKPDEVLDGEPVPQSSTPSWVGDPGPLGGDALPSLAGSLPAHET